jgi:hypothetical protein
MSSQAQARALVAEVRRNHHIDLLHRYDNEPPVPHCAVCGFTSEPCDGLILADALSASLAREEGLRERLAECLIGQPHESAVGCRCRWCKARETLASTGAPAGE